VGLRVNGKLSIITGMLNSSFLCKQAATLDTNFYFLANCNVSYNVHECTEQLCTETIQSVSLLIAADLLELTHQSSLETITGSFLCRNQPTKHLLTKEHLLGKLFHQVAPSTAFLIIGF